MTENFENQNNLERVINKYTYRDNHQGGKVIFECSATDILEADKLYEASTGNNPEKQPYVGCTIEVIPGLKE